MRIGSKRNIKQLIHQIPFFALIFLQKVSKYAGLGHEMKEK